MNTAQVSIELVLAGILALCAFVLPFFPGSDLTTDLLQNEALIGILGLAYLLGVTFDKLADTILHPIEHLLRLKQAGKYLEGHPKFKGKDPFPQNNLEFNLRKSKDGRLDWMNSLKSRIRTSRELAVLGLPATMGIAIHQGTSMRWIYIPVALNILFFIIAAWLESNASDEDSKDPRGKTRQLKTRDISPDKAIRRNQFHLAEKQSRKAALPYYLLAFNSAITTGIIATLNPDNTSIFMIGLGGTIITMLAFWACLRITRTYIKFVAQEMSVYLIEREK